MNTYLKELLEQITKAGFQDGDSLLVIANEGEPAYVQLRAGEKICTFKQNEDLTALVGVDTTTL